LPVLADYADVEVAVLDRCISPSIEGLERIEFPSYTWSYTAADSLLIDRICRDVGADVFISTYYTSPVSVPSVLVIYDMIPEALGFDLSSRGWQEKQIAISYASYYACISENTRSDLLKFYPNIGRDRVRVAHCGIDRGVFYTQEPHAVEKFKKRHRISRPYFLLVGSRGSRDGYKNAALLFRAMRQFSGGGVQIVCVGGEPEIGREMLDELPADVTAYHVSLTDRELACAYAGAEALVYPSLYEGFGLPVVEAMACGCPVITTPHGSLGEAAGNAAVFVSGKDEGELCRAMTAVREPARRKCLVERGLEQAARFSWDSIARELRELIQMAAGERESPEESGFFSAWKRLRAIQAEVDVG
jgi:glycosyltransferase involved in cell wall biosynthesis